jgi:hypothetical protein
MTVKITPGEPLAQSTTTPAIIQAVPEQSGKPYRVLITDADYKHTIALASYIKRELPDVHLIGHSADIVRFAKQNRCFDEFIKREPLENTLQKARF